MNTLATARIAASRNPELLIERARSLIPTLRARSAQTTAGRQLPSETVDDIRRLEFTRCLQPEMFGGFGANYDVFSKMLRTLAQGCGSTAWVCGVHGEHNWIIGNFCEETQRAVWGENPIAVASASFPPTGKIRSAPGGHRLDGRWSYLSGCDTAQWFLLMGQVQDGANVEERMFLIPASDAEIVDDWHVMGLCGTGSKSVVVKDSLVPLARSVTMYELKTGTAPGAAVHRGNVLYCSPRSLLASFSLSSVVVGLAERAVEDFTAITRERRSRGVRVADLESAQIAVAEAATQTELAVMLVETTIDRNIALVASGEPVTAEHLAWTRRNSTYATRLAYSAVKLIFEIAGGSALYESNPMQEIFRDATAGSSHLSLTWHRAAPLYGQLRLGLPVEFDSI
jgi:3-hydroxy-9,10-secoandrosta-1,3,5(10)-triene-9,17-dione monooxygenase